MNWDKRKRSRTGARSILPIEKVRLGYDIVLEHQMQTRVFHTTAGFSVGSYMEESNLFFSGFDGLQAKVYLCSKDCSIMATDLPNFILPVCALFIFQLLVSSLKHKKYAMTFAYKLCRLFNY